MAPDPADNRRPIVSPVRTSFNHSSVPGSKVFQKSLGTDSQMQASASKHAFELLVYNCLISHTEQTIKWHVAYFLFPVCLRFGFS